jgi:enoyl-CoA hydratase/carnithine racemase
MNINEDTMAKAANKVYEAIIVQRRRGALEITLNNPAKLNALSEQMVVEMMEAMRGAELDRKIVAVIIQGNERAFCAGADISAFKDTPKTRFDNYRARYNERPLRRIWHYLANYTKPVIAAVEGYALGGGLELALWCDFIVAGENAQFGLPESRLGLIPGAGGTQNLPRRIGPALAKELMWTARRIKAPEARECHLVNHVVAKGEALAKARELVAAMAQNGPLALMMIKQSVNRGMDLPLALAFEQEAEFSFALSLTEDRAEGVKAFAERRPPKFKGQ